MALGLSARGAFFHGDGSTGQPGSVVVVFFLGGGGGGGGSHLFLGGGSHQIFLKAKGSSLKHRI